MPHYLNDLFSPDSIAIIGASNRRNSVGLKVLKNLMQAKFKGELYPINPKHKSILKYKCFNSVIDVFEPISLAIITTPAHTIPNILRSCGEKGIRAAIIISAGFSEAGELGKALQNEINIIAAKYSIRFIGPNCLGVMRPHIFMNATFDNNNALPGHLALVSQSGALSAAILDWAMPKGIGFSALISLGNSANVDFGEVLNYLALDPKTKSILLYIEGIHYSRPFMSALRSAARMKPVIAIKSGRQSQGQKAASSHTGALIGNDDVFDIALRRAGAIRVNNIDELFSAAEILASPKKIKGNRLAIITNGGGAGVMAADCASDTNIKLPDISNVTLKKLNAVLPAHWSHANPIDIIGDATPQRYHQTLEICNHTDDIDGILSILVPVAMSHPIDVAKQLIQDEKNTDKPIIACWMGEKNVRSSWKLFSENRIPNFDTPEKAIQAFAHLADYAENQALLTQVPGPLSPQPKPNISVAQNIIHKAYQENRTTLTQSESKNILEAFNIPINYTINCKTEDEALFAAKKCGFPVAIKIDSPNITHKSDAGGVVLNIETETGVKRTFSHLMNKFKKSYPDAKIHGVTIEHMHTNPNNREVMIGIINDQIFGPVISFGTGGIFVEIIKDRALALPPLNKFIAKQLIQSTKMAKMLEKFRHMPSVDTEQLVNILLRVSEIACELPEIAEMDINPLLINDKESIAVDARFILKPSYTNEKPYSHMAIHPYPHQLVKNITLQNKKKITIRPIRPEDAILQKTFTQLLSPKSKYFMFHDSYFELTEELLKRFTQIDYDQEMTLIAIYKHDNKEINIGIARYIMNDDFNSCQFSLVIADHWQNQGVGSQLMHSLISIAKSKKIQTMSGDILANNNPMLAFIRKIGFIIRDKNAKFKRAYITL